MKKLLLLLFIFSSFYFPAKSQSYTPFPENKAFWEIWDRPDLSNPDPYNEYHNYKMEGDTLIGSYSYNKIYRHDWKGYIGYVYIPITGYYYYGGIRQDIVNKRVYAVLPPDNTDTLLYDYNLTVGDTILHTYTCFCDGSFNPPYSVTNIDSVTFNGHPFREFKLDHLMNDASWIEGVGSHNGLFEKTFGWFEAGPQLINFCNSDVDDCSPLALGIEPITADQNNITVYPNPFHDRLNIAYTGQKPERVELFNILGIKVYDGTDSKIESGLSSLSNGIYFIQFTTYQGKFTRQLIKE